MSPDELYKELVCLYGARYTKRALAIRLASDMGLASHDTVRRWLVGDTPVPPYLGLVLEALWTLKFEG